MKTYGEILKKLREEKGLSQDELAQACNIPVGTVRNHEQVRTVIPLADMFIYCQALNVDCTVFQKGQPTGKGRRQDRKPGKKKSSKPRSSKS